jgi:OmpA-OmpF porin, OOP family
MTRLTILLTTGFIFAAGLGTFAQETASAVGSEAAEIMAGKKTETKTVKRGKKEKNPYVSPYYAYDDDKDGVPNYRDKCPHTPSGEKVTPFGCPPDIDFDGVFDFEDNCDTIPGPRENKGCPWGDRDNDRVTDNVDRCPDVPGDPYNMGCPVVKKDSDGDGIFDADDVCPDVPGTIANHGCPEIRKEEKEVLKRAFENLLFEFNKDVIRPSSFASLNELAAIMKQNSESRLHLEGHTDNVGEDDKNLDLSRRRAAAVRTYLVEKGISEYRLTTDGFGESRPKDTNESDAGRAKNRRVEMIFHYEKAK